MHSGVIARTCTRFSSIHVQRPFSSPGCAAQFQWASNCCKQFSLIFVILGDSRAVSSHASSEDERRRTGPIESTHSPTSSCINANDAPTDTDPAPKSHVADHNSDAVAVNVPDDRGRKATAHLDRFYLTTSRSSSCGGFGR